MKIPELVYILSFLFAFSNRIHTQENQQIKTLNPSLITNGILTIQAWDYELEDKKSLFNYLQNYLSLKHPNINYKIYIVDEKFHAEYYDETNIYSPSLIDNYKKYILGISYESMTYLDLIEYSDEYFEEYTQRLSSEYPGLRLMINPTDTEETLRLLEYGIKNYPTLKRNYWKLRKKGGDNITEKDKQKIRITPNKVRKIKKSQDKNIRRYVEQNPGVYKAATFRIDRTFPADDTVEFDNIEFRINTSIIMSTDTSINKIQLKEPFDRCVINTPKDTLSFFTRFIDKERYIIRPGCCCSNFTLQPETEASRGTVTFNNTTNRDLVFIVCEHNYDTVPSGTQKTLFAHESRMCYFKPCRIQIVETEYFSDKYIYKKDNRDYTLLWEERDNYILSEIWFHFLHGEKIEILYNNENKKEELILNGYLSNKEYSQYGF